MTDRQEAIATLALSRLHGISLVNARLLYDRAGSALSLMERHDHVRDLLPDASQRLVDALADVGEATSRAEAEMAFAEKHSIQVLTLNDPDYPQLLRECKDAPLALFYRGTAPLNRPHIISMVGTRRITQYGKDLCRDFVDALCKACPDICIVSGLAYGVDVHCHEAALRGGGGHRGRAGPRAGQHLSRRPPQDGHRDAAPRRTPHGIHERDEA